MKIATSKLEDLEDLNDKIQSNLTSLFKQHFKELTPHPKIVDDTESDRTMFKSKPYKNLASVGRVTVSKGEDTTQKKNAMSEKPIVNSDKRKKTEDNHKSNPSKQQIVINKKDVKRLLAVRETTTKIPQPLARQSNSAL